MIGDLVVCADSRDLSFIPNKSVHLIITSPPYNVGKDYELGESLEAWHYLLEDVLYQCKRKLVDGGRLCINVANTWRKPYQPLHAYVIGMADDLGLLMRGEIIWDKGASVGVSTAWGSWKSASNPTLRDVHEYILVFSKGEWGRGKGDSTITRDEFLEYTKSVWQFPTVSAKKVGHPAPFPLELPERLIKLYSFAGDLVLDPFCGSGQTCIAAMKLERYYIGVDIIPQYVDLTMRRLDEYRNLFKTGDSQ